MAVVMSVTDFIVRENTHTHTPIRSVLIMTGMHSRCTVSIKAIDVSLITGSVRVSEEYM